MAENYATACKIRLHGHRTRSSWLGDSDLTESGYTKTNVAEDVRQIVQSLGFKTIRLVGTDIGAMVAYAYASRHPEEIDRLVFAESLIPGFGLEELMNPATGGYWHLGFHMQVEVATMLTAGKEDAYLLPSMGMMSTSPDATEVAKASFLPYYVRPGRMKAGFQHYGRPSGRWQSEPGHLHLQAGYAGFGVERRQEHCKGTDSWVRTAHCGAHPGRSGPE
jgi:pimeloyl-ACP methyl ester carboxylesterase